MDSSHSTHSLARLFDPRPQLPVYEDVAEGAPLPATTICFPQEHSTEGALVIRLSTLLQALQYTITVGHTGHVIKARKPVRAGVNCGLRLDLYRAKTTGMPLATVTRLEGDKMAFCALWQELTTAIQSQTTSGTQQPPPQQPLPQAQQAHNVQAQPATTEQAT